jgi:drug/metabolite transporter (DMT)-like permease
MDRRSWGLLIALAAIWGASYMLIKIGLRDLSPGMIACVRVALAALVVAPFAVAQGALRGVRKAAVILVVVAAIQVAGPFYLIGVGEQEISSALAGILVATTPIFTAILAIWIDHEERSQGLRLVGIAIGMGGVMLVLGIDLSGSGPALLGGLVVVLAGLGYAVGGFMVKHKLTLNPIGMTAAIMSASAVLLAPTALATLPSDPPGVGPLAAVAALGLVGTGLAFVIFYGLIARVGPARTWLVAYLAPGFAVVYGATLLGEAITVATVGGLALILAGSWLAAQGRLPLRPVSYPAPEEGGGSVPAVPDLAAERFEDR